MHLVYCLIIPTLVAHNNLSTAVVIIALNINRSLRVNNCISSRLIGSSAFIHLRAADRARKNNVVDCILTGGTESLSTTCYRVCNINELRWASTAFHICLSEQKGALSHRSRFLQLQYPSKTLSSPPPTNDLALLPRGIKQYQNLHRHSTSDCHQRSRLHLFICGGDG